VPHGSKPNPPLARPLHIRYRRFMDHKTFLATLPPDVTTRLSAKHNAGPVVHLVAHLGLILLTGTLISIRIPFWPALLPVHGVLLVFLFTLEHEATHKTPFANERLNEWVGRTIGLIIFLPFQWFRYFHLAHHRHTNNPEKDPELLAGAKPENWAQYIAHVSGLPYWAAMITHILRAAVGRTDDAFLPKPALPRIRAQARWMLFIYVILGLSLFFSPALVWLWLLPLLLGQPFLRLYLLAEHGRCAPVANMFENTRTTFTTRAIRFIAWNMPYHTEHHIMPGVPYHQLPQLHEYTRLNLLETADGYARFTRTYVAGMTGSEAGQ